MQDTNTQIFGTSHALIPLSLAPYFAAELLRSASHSTANGRIKTGAAQRCNITAASCSRLVHATIFLAATAPSPPAARIACDAADGGWITMRTIDDPGSTGLLEIHTSAAICSRVAPCEGADAASTAGRNAAVCWPLHIVQTDRMMKSILGRLGMFGLTNAWKSCSKQHAQSVTNGGTPPPSDSTDTFVRTGSWTPHVRTNWRKPAATVGGGVGTSVAMSHKSPKSGGPASIGL